MTGPTIDEFAQQLVAEDELGSVVRAHLHVEHHMEELVRAVVQNPGALKHLGLDFAGKVHLLSVVGFDDELTKPLLGLGSVRNKFAHRLNCKLTPQMMRELYDSLGKTGKQSVHEAYDRTRKQSDAKHPKKLWSLDPKMIFCMLASTIRVQLLLAIKLQTGSYPPGSVPDRFVSKTSNANSRR